MEGNQEFYQECMQKLPLPLNLYGPAKVRPLLLEEFIWRQRAKKRCSRYSLDIPRPFLGSRRKKDRDEPLLFISIFGRDVPLAS